MDPRGLEEHGQSMNKEVGGSHGNVDAEKMIENQCGEQKLKTTRVH